jgi:uncharacterized membrane protein YedE/YeeE
LASTTHDLSAPAEAAHERTFEPKPYSNPYLAGIGLGLVLLSAFVLMGRGLGASGAFNSTIAWLVSLIAPGYAASNGFLSRYLDVPGHPLEAWLVFEVLGVFAGAVLSGVLARRMSRTVERGPHASVGLRLALASLGGFIMAFGAALGRGCTSGQALTGGALLNVGSWIFMMCFFGGAYAFAWFVRRQWR